MTKGRSLMASSADAVVAATAGEDSWKTWAGRSHGSSDFQWTDLLRGSKRALEKAMLKKGCIPLQGSTCPVCFCVPTGSEWHVTSSCSHAVCLDCLRAYAASQVKDPLQSGPLKCPVCPQVLRRKDAFIALKGDSRLISQWDEKIRNQLLRALPSYRPCPNCKQRSNNGGGFVTPECLAPQYQERRDEASRLLQQEVIGPILSGAYIFTLSRLISWFPCQSPRTDLFFLLFSLITFFPNLRYLQRLAAECAHEALFRPISVECPCCDDSFVLPASSTDSDIVDAESKQWMTRHARHCPSCSVPITKHGGCNHMQCPNCHASFCWACMQLRTHCRPYQCQNGSRYGNAVSGQSDAVTNVRSEDSILNRIDSILSRSAASVPYWENGLVLVGMIGRYFRWLQFCIEPIMNLLAAFFTVGSSSWLILGWITWNFCKLCHAIQHPRRQATTTAFLWNPESTMIQSSFLQTENAMIQEAIRRSLQEH